MRQTPDDIPTLVCRLTLIAGLVVALVRAYLSLA